MALQILIVEDDLDLAATLIDFLTLEGYQCDHAGNGVAGLGLAKSRRFDVIVLDIALPRMSGLSVCEALRADGIDSSVLMLTARDTLEDKLAGFVAGTDDYLVKPFELKELSARIGALAVRRSGQARRMQVADLEIDLEQRRVTRAGRECSVTPTGWTLLEALVRASPDVVSRDRLRDAVWGDEPPESNSLKVHLHRLRKDIDHGFDTRLIVTVPGHGVAIRGADENA